MAGIDSASLIETLQSSLTAKNSTKAIMEFALSITAQAKFENTNQTEILESVFRMLKASGICLSIVSKMNAFNVIQVTIRPAPLLWELDQ